MQSYQPRVPGVNFSRLWHENLYVDIGDSSIIMNI